MKKSKHLYNIYKAQFAKAINIINKLIKQNQLNKKMESNSKEKIKYFQIEYQLFLEDNYSVTKDIDLETEFFQNMNKFYVSEFGKILEKLPSYELFQDYNFDLDTISHNTCFLIGRNCKKWDNAEIFNEIGFERLAKKISLNDIRCNQARIGNQLNKDSAKYKKLKNFKLRIIRQYDKDNKKSTKKYGDFILLHFLSLQEFKKAKSYHSSQKKTIDNYLQPQKVQKEAKSDKNLDNDIQQSHNFQMISNQQSQLDLNISGFNKNISINQKSSIEKINCTLSDQNKNEKPFNQLNGNNLNNQMELEQIDDFKRETCSGDGIYQTESGDYYQLQTNQKRNQEIHLFKQEMKSSQEKLFRDNLRLQNTSQNQILTENFNKKINLKSNNNQAQLRKEQESIKDISISNQNIQMYDSNKYKPLSFQQQQNDTLQKKLELNEVEKKFKRSKEEYIDSEKEKIDTEYKVILKKVKCFENGLQLAKLELETFFNQNPGYNVKNMQNQQSKIYQIDD
ncbi:hypothetical protein TTHERM_00249620 (macronuclear) [Tetrahymena thermophila SB210]|uniref:Uncharacterized protein n=1 Tax=Tetrahymena thermophila (strain SB210) TaxID=312017 RepID=Q23QX1_TETTS|nr:hypothetical protein TTHERM_00249620 [Tetrahymena thermophila SB210]EAR98767.2 hypothetical protein TTHERM_00249620 [Tetrahymena thermophila SB210]|eukprot:XP_001019012.2 hypothetical protein TTHERM_00249620 [Tetrahymena thermophila SB210]